MADIVARISKKAIEHGLVPYEFLGGAIAESGLNPGAWRQGVWPDWSAGLFQQTVLYAEEGDHTASDENVALIKRLYFDIDHACDVAAVKFKNWRYDPEVSALQAWTAYNLPASYRLWPNVPNVEQRENYRRGLEEARRLLGASPMPALTYNPDTPPERQIADWVCSIRATSWILKSLGLPVDIGALQDEMSPRYVTPDDGLLDARGYGVAEVIRAHLPPAWQGQVHVYEAISWDELASLAGNGPIALGLRGAYHWLNVAKPLLDGALSAPNPAPNYPPTGPIGDTLTQAEFSRYGPASAVFVNAVASSVPVEPPPPADPRDARIAELEAQVAQLLDDLADRNTRLGVASVDYVRGLRDLANAYEALKP